MAERDKKHPRIGVHISLSLHEKARMSWSLLNVCLQWCQTFWRCWGSISNWLRPGSFLLSEESCEQNALFQVNTWRQFPIQNGHYVIPEATKVTRGKNMYKTVFFYLILLQEKQPMEGGSLMDNHGWIIKINHTPWEACKMFRQITPFH